MRRVYIAIVVLLALVLLVNIRRMSKESKTDYPPPEQIVRNIEKAPQVITNKTIPVLLDALTSNDKDMDHDTKVDVERALKEKNINELKIIFSM